MQKIHIHTYIIYVFYMFDPYLSYNDTYSTCMLDPYLTDNDRDNQTKSCVRVTGLVIFFRLFKGVKRGKLFTCGRFTISCFYVEESFPRTRAGYNQKLILQKRYTKDCSRGEERKEVYHT